jgi:hypothetical protein
VVIKKKNELVRLENEVFLKKIVFGMFHGRPYKGFQKIPHIPISIICHYNLFIQDNYKKKFNPQNSTISLAITIFLCTYTQAYSTPFVY